MAAHSPGAMKAQTATTVTLNMVVWYQSRLASATWVPAGVVGALTVLMLREADQTSLALYTVKRVAKALRMERVQKYGPSFCLDAHQVKLKTQWVSISEL